MEQIPDEIFVERGDSLDGILMKGLSLRENSTDREFPTLTFGDIILDTGLAPLICTSNEQKVRLSEKEYKILEYMISNQGQILTREQLAVKIWGFESEAEYNNVEVYMSFTRKKLAFVGAKTVIKAVRGIGYELRCEAMLENIIPH